MTTYTATYSPDDNKLRLYASSRLDAETYARVKAAGFKWAPKQELFVAPMWTPSREDLLIELAGEIEDEDKSLVDRAEERADRFEDYSDKRAADSQRAHDQVSRIADGIPMGQPILVGHHSERHARKDAQRIENGMRKAVKMWETSKYWTSRAAGAIHHAKYKELPAVRARRIKTIEADLRRVQRTRDQSERRLAQWTALSAINDPATRLEGALRITNTEAGGSLILPSGEHHWSAWGCLKDGKATADYVIERRMSGYPGSIAHSDRWIAHYQNRLAYERAMLEEQGATKLLDPKPRRELPPLLNYRAAGGVITTENEWNRGHSITYPQVEMTKAEYAKINQDYRGVRWSQDRQHRFRTAMVKHSLVSVFLTDSKAVEQPAPQERPAPEPVRRDRLDHAREVAPDPMAEQMRAMKDTLRNGGVKVVTAPQLFPTPPEIAARMVEMACLRPGERVLEPSAGTGRILDAISEAEPEAQVVAVEINATLCGQLDATGRAVVCGDFLDCEPAALWGRFDAVIMNPPFQNGADIKHIQHARKFLKPGGRLVALCANGNRQIDALQGIATHWEELPEGSFKSEGTGVRVALLVIYAEQAAALPCSVAKRQGDMFGAGAS